MAGLSIAHDVDGNNYAHVKHVVKTILKFLSGSGLRVMSLLAVIVDLLKALIGGNL